jgi:hypothetical protein
MARFYFTLIVAATWMASLSVAALAQMPPVAADRPTTDLTAAGEPDPLPGLPRPPDQPGSLLQPAPTGPVYACPQLETPYFAKDPLLDPADLPHPGWLFDVEMDIMGSHVVNRLGETAAPIAGVGNVPMAALDWTISPRFEAGYRLPSAFGEVDFAYQFLRTDGSGATAAGSTASPDAAAALKSHLDMQIGDLDYASVETSLGPNWGMKWRIGLRTADVFFASQADEPLAAATAGSGIFARSIENNFWGIGPHAGVELKRRCGAWGLGWVARLDGALLFGDVQQRFAQVSTAGVTAQTDFDNPEQVPMVSGFVGLAWRPPSCPSLDLLLGYTAEYWWNVGRLSDPDIYNGRSAGEVGCNGAVLRLEYNY